MNIVGDAMPGASALSAGVQLAEADAPHGEKLEGCALQCGNSSEATLAASKPTAGPRCHVLDPKTVAQALSRSDGPEWEKVLLAEVRSCLALGV
jgi:hypothetical protein